MTATAAPPGIDQAGRAGRVSFYEEQASRRRHARWWSLFIGPTAVLTGLPLAAVLSPLVFGAVVLALRLAGLAIPLPEALWDLFRYLAGALPAAFGRVVDSPGAADAGGERWTDLAAAVLMLLGPGLVASCLLWRAVAALVTRVGAEAELIRLGAREPRPDDLEELQLMNVVAEMAIAAGVPPPAVRLIDDPEPRAALLGVSPRDATVVISRGVLDRCDRAATQGIVAHLVASQVNGDLRFGRTVLSVFQTMGLTFTLLDALLSGSPSAWRDLRTFSRGVRGGTGGGEPARRLAELLAGDPTSFRQDGLHGAFLDSMEEEPKTRIGRTLGRFPLFWALLLPFLLPVVLVLFLRMEVLLLRALVISPLVVPVLRARRYLADATAVELTRDPDAVAAGLAALAPGEGAAGPPGGPWLEHRFVVGRGGTTPAGPESDRSRPLTGTAAPHPPLAKRLGRLVRLGAGPEWLAAAAGGAAKPARPRFRDLSVGRRVVGVLVTIALVPVLALCAYLTLVVVVAVVGMGVAGSVFFAAVAMHLIERLLIPSP